MSGVIDNDVLFKGACYGLLSKLAAFVDPTSAPIGVLGAAPYVVRGVIARANLKTSRSVVVGRLEQFLETARILEPTEPEQALAAAIELVAQREALLLHAGESQLCAISVARGLSRVLTGDKQAIVAMDRLLDSLTELARLVGRVFCLEQAILWLLDATDAVSVRTAVCSEPKVDVALSMCFSCATGSHWTDDSANGLNSYIRSLRFDASRILAV